MSIERKLRHGMKCLLLFTAFAVGSLLRVSPLYAQRRFGAMPPVFHSRGTARVVPRFRRVGRIPPSRASGFPFPDHRRRRKVFEGFGCPSAVSGLNLQQALAPYPGYGFDFEYLNATNRDLAVKAAIDPSTELQLNELERPNCAETSDFGYLILDDGDYLVPDETTQESEQPSQPITQPQIIIVQEQSPPAQPTAQVSTPSQPAAPLLDEGQFELMLRSGALLQAVAFTRDRDKIIYITPQGARRMIALSDLDIAATIRINEEHGSPIQLSF
jgi:hypothetical protein